MPSARIIAYMAVLLALLGLLQMVPSFPRIPGRVPAAQAEDNVTAAADPNAENWPDHEEPEDYVWDSSEVVYVALNGATITASGAGAAVDGSIVTITRGGTYSFSGTLADGQIIVDAQNKKTVRLILAGADIRCSWSAPILVENARKTVIVLAENTANYAADGRSGSVEEATVDEPNAVIFSRDDLTIWGPGSLTVSSHVKDGISSKDGLIIAGGIIDVNAVDDGIRGKDYLVVRGGAITVRAGGDGLKSDNDEDPMMGYVSLEAGTLWIISKGDAIQAKTDVLISGGQATCAAGGGSRIRGVTNKEAKGITAGVSVIVTDGSLAIDSADDAVHSNGSLAIHGGVMALSSLDDAIHADCTADITNGDITVATCYEGIDSNAITLDGGSIKIVSTDDGIVAGQHVFIGAGVINVTSGADAISAGTELTIVDGQFTLTSGGGSNRTIAAALSAKGIKGTGGVIIDGGGFLVDSADDAVHSNGDVTINGGTFTVYSGDDGLHADANLVINGGEIHIAKSYEGMESAKGNIIINDGNIHIVSSDDGINVSAGGDTMGLGVPGGMPGGVPAPGGATPGTAGSYYLYVHGGYLVVDAMGDGIDSNGSIEMTGGTVIVNGPTANDNGALDHSSFTMTGGFIVAAGSSGMAQTASDTSTQYAILLTLNTTLSASTLIHIQDSTGRDILSFKPTKQYNSVAFSSQALAKGSTYDVYYGGSSTGTANDGLYVDGTYSPGTKYTSFTITNVVTNVGLNTAPGGGGTGGGGGGTPRR